MSLIYDFHHGKLGNIKEMEGQQICSQSQAQYLETELTKMLPNVVLQMSEVNEQCIYKVPQKFREGNPKAYTPQVVSIGPFHKPRDSNGENNTLVRMEELKLEYLRRFLNRSKQLSMKHLFQRLIEKEKRIRSCYGEPINCNSNDFLTMILVDACFIIEHFLRFYTGLASIDIDPLSKSWLVNDVFHDLTLLENQLPFSVLEDIFNSAKPGVMEMPCLTIEDRTETLFRNILALEQCHYILSPNVTQFLFLLNFLINTEKDVNILVDKKIIVNWMGDANAVVKMFNSLCSNVIVSYMSEEYCTLYHDLIKFHENPRNKYKAIFYHEYFNTPWKKASTTAAVLLLLFTLIQAICSVISLF
ncbi:hypothetical protein JHK86_003472 [Glycine max]|nr:hypothetical protein JHK86_003472 [Glycine max]